jgi:crotonobetainyl-CoA:carnitine CoA-transferase CaiB-like acyl-CoA transferase
MTYPKVMDGVRVLEVAAWTYVPSAGAVLAEWGADVLKIEHPEGGDPQRGLMTSGLVPNAPVNHMIELPNRGKRSVAVDLATEGGRELLLQLAATSDVFLTNFLPAARRRLRIDVEDVRRANPDIIYVRGSGQGQRGPERERGGYDGSAFWARSVATVASPPSQQWPSGQPGPAFGDLLGGLTIAGGIAAALYHRKNTGEATVVDNSLLGTAMWAVGATLLAAGINGDWTPTMPDRSDLPNPVVNTYRTSDNRFIALILLQSDRYWDEFVAACGRPDLAVDERFRDSAARYTNRKECIAELDAVFATRTFDEWCATLVSIEGVWAPVLSPNEVLRDPQVAANGYLREVRLTESLGYQVVPSPLQFNEEPPDVTRAPEHGEHTDEVLGELGLDMEQILDLKVKGVIL